MDKEAILCYKVYCGIFREDSKHSRHVVKKTFVDTAFYAFRLNLEVRLNVLPRFSGVLKKNIIYDYIGNFVSREPFPERPNDCRSWKAV